MRVEPGDCQTTSRVHVIRRTAAPLWKMTGGLCSLSPMKFSVFSLQIGMNRLYWASTLLVLLSLTTSPFALDFTKDQQEEGHGIVSGREAGRPEVGTLYSDAQTFVGDVSLVETAYKVGPGDLFQFFIEASAFERRVNPEGNILMPRIGSVHVEGLSLGEAKKLLLDRLETSFKRTNCFVNLSRPKMMRVYATGAINGPGVYEVPGTDRLLDLLRRAGGFSAQAQRGSVLIVSGKDTIQKINIRDFKLIGNLESNPYLCQGCVVQVPFLDFHQPWVVLRHDSTAQYIQLNEGESTQEILRKAYSYDPSPVFTSILVREKNGSNQVLLPADVSSYKPGSEAVIEMSFTRNDVFVGGAVQTPGYQAYQTDRKVVEYISRSGILTTSKIPNRILVIHRDGKRGSLSLQSSDLRPGDVVIVKQNTEQKILLYTPILLSIVSLGLVILQL